MIILGRLLLVLIDLALLLLLLRAIISWLPILLPNYRPGGFMAGLFSAIKKITEPPIAWLGRYLRPIRFGAVGLDMAFLILVVLLLLLQRIVIWLW